MGTVSGKTQRIAVWLIIVAVVGALVLSLVGNASAATTASGVTVRADAAGLAAETATPSPSPTASPTSQAEPENDSVFAPPTGEPKPITETPQGQPTQVNDGEHVGGLIAYLVFMAGGVLLAIRGHRRAQAHRAAESAEDDGAAESTDSESILR